MRPGVCQAGKKERERPQPGNSATAGPRNGSGRVTSACRQGLAITLQRQAEAARQGAAARKLGQQRHPKAVVEHRCRVTNMKGDPRGRCPSMLMPFCPSCCVTMMGEPYPRTQQLGGGHDGTGEVLATERADLVVSPFFLRGTAPTQAHEASHGPLACLSHNVSRSSAGRSRSLSRSLSPSTHATRNPHSDSLRWGPGAENIAPSC